MAGGAAERRRGGAGAGAVLRRQGSSVHLLGVRRRPGATRRWPPRWSGSGAGRMGRLAAVLERAGRAGRAGDRGAGAGRGRGQPVGGPAAHRRRAWSRPATSRDRKEAFDRFLADGGPGPRAAVRDRDRPRHRPGPRGRRRGGDRPPWGRGREHVLPRGRCCRSWWPSTVWTGSRSTTKITTRTTRARLRAAGRRARSAGHRVQRLPRHRQGRPRAGLQHHRSGRSITRWSPGSRVAGSEAEPVAAECRHAQARLGASPSPTRRAAWPRRRPSPRSAPRWAEQGRRVLLVDLDPAGLSDLLAGLSTRRPSTRSVHQVLLGEAKARGRRAAHRRRASTCCPATIELATAEQLLLMRTGREQLLKTALGAAARPLRRHPAGLPADAGHPDHARPDRGPRRADPVAVRDAEPPGRRAAAGHHPRRQEDHQPPAQR